MHARTLANALFLAGILTLVAAGGLQRAHARLALGDPIDTSHPSQQVLRVVT
jgi:hypothetical protein